MGWTGVEGRVRTASEGIISVYGVVGLQNSNLRQILKWKTKNV
jgi:hypothetical protein